MRAKVLVGLLLAFLAFNSWAMDFRIYHQLDLNLNVVIAEGLIKDGDAQKFIAYSKKADRDHEGHVILVLNSPGGSVAAAFKLVEAMDEIGVYTIVPDNALCASACASIIYPSGARRDVRGTGKLGFHSCYSKKNNRKIESAFCNELIAENAMMRGLAHASVSLFVNDYGADDMAWVGRDVACTMLPGMCKPTLKVAIVPSFNCGKARTQQEIVICDDESLAKLDVIMAKVFREKLSTSDNPRKVQEEQANWLKYQRGKCLDKTCLKTVYEERIAALLIKPKD